MTIQQYKSIKVDAITYPEIPVYNKGGSAIGTCTYNRDLLTYRFYPVPLVYLTWDNLTEIANVIQSLNHKSKK